MTDTEKQFVLVQPKTEYRHTSVRFVQKTVLTNQTQIQINANHENTIEMAPLYSIRGSNTGAPHPVWLHHRHRLQYFDIKVDNQTLCSFPSFPCRWFQKHILTQSCNSVSFFLSFYIYVCRLVISHLTQKPNKTVVNCLYRWLKLAERSANNVNITLNFKHTLKNLKIKLRC